jgi:hypothetical protein
MSIKEIFLNVIDRVITAKWILVSPPIINEIDRTLRTGTTAGSRKTLAATGALRKQRAVPANPIPRLTQKRLDNRCWLRSLR